MLDKLASAGAEVERRRRRLPRARRATGCASFDVVTLPYPGFPTDLQPFAMALAAVSDGTAMITENVFEARFMFAQELARLGADLRTDGHHAVVRGKPVLSGAPVVAHDIRAGAALVLAGLAAQGTTTVAESQHIDRGYPYFVEMLSRSRRRRRAGSTYPTCEDVTCDTPVTAARQPFGLLLRHSGCEGRPRGVGPRGGSDAMLVTTEVRRCGSAAGSTAAPPSEVRDVLAAQMSALPRRGRGHDRGGVGRRDRAAAARRGQRPDGARGPHAHPAGLLAGPAPGDRVHPAAPLDQRRARRRGSVA